MRVLFTTQPGSGHWRPLAPFAHALTEAGHEVAFATTPAFCPIIAAHGFRCFAVGADDAAQASDSHRQDLGTEPEQAAAVWVNLFAGARASRALPDLLATCRAWKPQIVVRELTEFAGCIAAERLGLPHAAVQVSAFRPHLHQRIAAPLNRLRTSVGLPPDPSLDMLYRYLLLAPVPPSFQNPDAALPPTAHAVRHVPCDLLGDEGLPAWVRRLPAQPTVYATLGTAYNRTPGVFAAILGGLDDLPLNLIVTAGDQDPAAFGTVPPHVHIERYIPQSLLFPFCDLVVTHGGFGTVMTSLDHGLPMVVVPIAADQPDNARRCADLGLARVVAPGDRTPDAIRTAVLAVLGGPAYRARAARLRDELRALPDLGFAVTLLERLAVG